MIGRWTTDQYLRLARWAIASGVLIIIGTTVFGIIPGSSLAWNAAVFFLLGVVVVRQHGGKTEGLAAGVIVGLALGFFSAMATFVRQPSALAGVNIVAETLMTGLIAGLIITVTTLLTEILLRQK